MLKKWTLLLTCLCLLSPMAYAAPASQYWGFWDKSNEESVETIDHSLWSKFLGQYLLETPQGNLLHYGKVSEEHRASLQQYIKALTVVDPRRYAKAEQMAYWINLYNALTVELILSEYPVKSITKLGPWYAFGPWDEKITRVAGQSLTLNDIEHRILRPIWQDKRIHYAVNCASKGCPDLAAKAYTRIDLQEMLRAATHRFINQVKGVEFVDGRLNLSRIYEWYAVDFGSREELMTHLHSNSKESLRSKLKKYTGPIDYRYDWALNSP